MGYRLEVVWRPVVPDLTRSEWRSWRLHRRLSTHTTRSSLELWRPAIERNLRRLRSTVRGQPYLRNLDRWESLLARGDVTGLPDRVPDHGSAGGDRAWLPDLCVAKLCALREKGPELRRGDAQGRPRRFRGYCSAPCSQAAFSISAGISHRQNRT